LKKHISLDLWNTLITSNPEFSFARIKLLQESYLSDFNSEEISQAIEVIGRNTDDINMKTGVSLRSESMYSDVLTQFGITAKENEISELYYQLEPQFLSNLPELMYPSDELIEWFEKLVSAGHTLNISSNTAYIKGSTLTKALSEIGIIDYFDFLIFSDDIRCSKPSIKFFNHLVSECSKRGISKNEIIHIGDSYEADIEGARWADIACIHVSDSKQLLSFTKFD